MAALLSTSPPVSPVVLHRRISDRRARDESWTVRPPRRPDASQWQVARMTAPVPAPVQQELAG